MKLLISACLMGACCRCDGTGKRLAGLEALQQRHQLVPACPEQLGGLPTPRPPCEIRGGRVFDIQGEDRTAAFQAGAAAALLLYRQAGCQAALLKARSPSCGRGQVYDGSFSGRLRPGDGLTAQLLMAQGIRVFTEDEMHQLMAEGES